MDKTWMHCTDTSSDVYLKGVDNFLQFSFQNSEVEGEIPDFARYPRNVRLGLASDGDNLHPNRSIVLNGHSSYFIGGAIDEKTFQQDACNDFSHRFEDDEDFINWKRNDLDVISTDVTVADDITEDNESKSKADDELN
ncbi:hypothetical protein KY290_036691 [Solanum tuberosum]|uniref:Uncharacterized protein n=1 Tax=Solanum tuberosum TaxID=4113 RepID=A0ABQ7TV26_SOLTU|nr:hypothetical protein KY285_036010 [Solanum tuberosum]KAH0737986.1 hypothetical protein KY290_036691 [Solanum tuberosum]